MKQFLLGIFNGFGEIWSHKLRSLLTTVCVLMGVASLVLIAGLINGLFANWKSYMAETGMNQKVTISPRNPPEKQAHLAPLSPGLTMADIQVLRKELTYARYISPQVQTGLPLRRKNKTSSMSEVIGATQDVLPLNNLDVGRGRFISDVDLAEAAPVIVLGTDVIKDLYEPNERVLGTQVFMDTQPLTVVGILKNYELYNGKYNMLREKNRYAFIPLTTVQRRFLSSSVINTIEIQVTDVTHVGDLITQIDNILIHNHRGVHDFRSFAFAEFAQRASQMENAFMMVGGGIGLVTLVVGGIGIMNLMLASINERIREIGIRKALGAWNRDIFVQFIAESVSLSTFGGGLGIFGGVGAVRLMQHLMKDNTANFPVPQISSSAIMVGFAFSVLVGVIAGLYPAFRASRLDPIEALRYE